MGLPFLGFNKDAAPTCMLDHATLKARLNTNILLRKIFITSELRRYVRTDEVGVPAAETLDRMKIFFNAISASFRKCPTGRCIPTPARKTGSC